ncbi:PI-PLC X domain-containing protein 1 [Amia ocellicauda]|uniref:PI-PLC X domain-containing protein 1 n=1 Tax=Amia ocellicauda TaxID=2972642 RepID=UPI0034648D45
MASPGSGKYEDWMSQLPEQLWDMALYTLAIPGSHDALSYCLDMESPLIRSESAVLKSMDKVFPCITRPVIYKWATTQEKNIVEQLTEGIRYFDLRIAHKPQDSSDDLYYTHVVYTIRTVREVLKEVALWLTSHPKEIVILACSHFEGLNRDLHEKLISSLKTIFGSRLCPYRELLTLRSLWESGYQVIVSYEDVEAEQHPELWPAIPYWWANKLDAKAVVQFLQQRKHSGRPGGFFVAGLNLTADTQYIVRHPSQSIRTLTLHNYGYLAAWLQKQSPGPDPGCLNIIAGDFIGSVQFCSIVISLNKKLIQAEPEPTNNMH